MGDVPFKCARGDAGQAQRRRLAHDDHGTLAHWVGIKATDDALRPSDRSAPIVLLAHFACHRGHQGTCSPGAHVAGHLAKPDFGMWEKVQRETAMRRVYERAVIVPAVRCALVDLHHIAPLVAICLVQDGAVTVLVCRTTCLLIVTPLIRVDLLAVLHEL